MRVTSQIWTGEEIRQLYELGKKHGNDFSQIANKMPSKDIKQIESKAYRLFENMLKGRIRIDEEIF